MHYLNRVVTGLAFTKPQQKFLQTLFSAWLSIRGRVNFLQLSRCSSNSEKYYRRWFSRYIDWTTFYLRVLKLLGIGKCLIAIDNVTWAKAGKKTYGFANFWSSSDKKMIKGIDFLSMALVSQEWKTGFHINAVQNNRSLSNVDERMQLQICFLEDELKKLRGITEWVVGDGNFARRKFIDVVTGQGFKFISKLRQDAELFHLFTGLQPVKGRKRKMDGKVDWKDQSRMNFVGYHNGCTVYELNGFNYKFNRVVKAVYIYDPKAKDYMILMCTDVQTSALMIIEYYRLRFQIEFLYRDTKQHCSLSTCQSQKKEALLFHVNAAMTSVNLAKADILRENHFDPETIFSLSDYIQRNSNILLTQRIIARLGFELSQRKRTSLIRHSASFGLIHVARAA